MNDLGSVIGLGVTIVGSAVAVAAFVTTRFAKLEVEVKHAFLRIAALEEANRPVPAAARRSKPKRR